MIGYSILFCVKNVLDLMGSDIHTIGGILIFGLLFFIIIIINNISPDEFASSDPDGVNLLPPAFIAAFVFSCLWPILLSIAAVVGVLYGGYYMTDRLVKNGISSVKSALVEKNRSTQ